MENFQNNPPKYSKEQIVGQDHYSKSPETEKDLEFYIQDHFDMNEYPLTTQAVWDFVIRDKNIEPDRIGPLERAASQFKNITKDEKTDEDVKDLIMKRLKAAIKVLENTKMTPQGDTSAENETEILETQEKPLTYNEEISKTIEETNKDIEDYKNNFMVASSVEREELKKELDSKLREISNVYHRVFNVEEAVRQWKEDIVEIEAEQKINDKIENTNKYVVNYIDNYRVNSPEERLTLRNEIKGMFIETINEFPKNPIVKQSVRHWINAIKKIENKETTNPLHGPEDAIENEGKIETVDDIVNDIEHVYEIGIKKDFIDLVKKDFESNTAYKEQALAEARIELLKKIGVFKSVDEELFSEKAKVEEEVKVDEINTKEVKVEKNARVDEVKVEKVKVEKKEAEKETKIDVAKSQEEEKTKHAKKLYQRADSAVNDYKNEMQSTKVALDQVNKALKEVAKISDKDKDTMTASLNTWKEEINSKEANIKKRAIEKEVKKEKVNVEKTKIEKKTPEKETKVNVGKFQDDLGSVNSEVLKYIIDYRAGQKKDKQDEEWTRARQTVDEFKKKYKNVPNINGTIKPWNEALKRDKNK